MPFPSVLAFKNPPEEIEYEITSKHVPDVTKGKIFLISEKNGIYYNVNLLYVFSQFHNDIALLEQPVRKFLRAGCFLFHSLFPLQGFFFEGIKSSQHFLQMLGRKAGGFFALLILFRQFWRSFL